MDTVIGKADGNETPQKGVLQQAPSALCDDLGSAGMNSSGYHTLAWPGYAFMLIAALLPRNMNDVGSVAQLSHDSVYAVAVLFGCVGACLVGIGSWKKPVGLNAWAKRILFPLALMVSATALGAIFGVGAAKCVRDFAQPIFPMFVMLGLLALFLAGDSQKAVMGIVILVAVISSELGWAEYRLISSRECRFRGSIEYAKQQCGQAATLEQAWHTFFTGIYRVESVQALAKNSGCAR